MRDPRHIDMVHPTTDEGHYITASGDIEHGTVEYILDLLNRTVGNPYQTISKDKLKHIAAQLLARNVLVEKNNDALRAQVGELAAELAKLKELANTTSVSLDVGKITIEDVDAMNNALVKLHVSGRGFLG